MTAAIRLAEIRTSPLSVDEVIGAVSAAEHGGIAVFLGTVRDHDEGRGVRLLEYSAHPTAAAELQRVMSEVVAEAPTAAIAAIHRVGTLQVGDVAVIVAAAAAHRDEAFQIGRTLIDRIKAEVPLWKRQQFDDGASIWVGACE